MLLTYPPPSCTIRPNLSLPVLDILDSKSEFLPHSIFFLSLKLYWLQSIGTDYRVQTPSLLPSVIPDQGLDTEPLTGPEEGVFRSIAIVLTA